MFSVPTCHTHSHSPCASSMPSLTALEGRERYVQIRSNTSTHFYTIFSISIRGPINSQNCVFFEGFGTIILRKKLPFMDITCIQCCQVSVFYRNFTDLSWLSSWTTPLGYKRTERGTPSQPCITSPFKQQTISQSCSHHFLLKYDQ